MEATETGVEIRVHLYPVGIEFQLRGIQQGLIGGKAGDNFIHCLNKADDVGHGAIRHGGGDIPRHRVRQSRTDVRLGQLLGPGPLAVQNIAKALHQNLAIGQHVGQLTHLLSICDGLVKRNAEIVRAENGEVRVVALHLFVGMAVDHCQVVVVVLLADKAAGVLAERADLVLEGAGISDELGLVQHPVHRFHDLIADLYTDTDVDGAGSVGNVVLGAELLQPVRAAAARGHYSVLGVDLQLFFAIADRDALADLILQNQILALIAEVNLHAVVQQELLNAIVNGLGFFRAHVADGTVHQLQSGMDGAAADFLPLLVVAKALNVLIGAKIQINLIRVVDGLLCQLRPDQVRQIAAHLIAEGQLAV